MIIPSARSSILAGVVLFLHAACAVANIRAPHRVENGPSTHLRVPAEGLTALGESLRFDIADTTATVTAVYTIHCEAAGPRVFDFVLPAGLSGRMAKPKLMSPADVKLTGRINGVAVNIEPLHTLDQEAGFEQKLSAFLEGQEPTGSVRKQVAQAAARMYVARFPGNLRAGRNILEVAYTRPLERREFGHSYFRNGRYVGGLGYELSPLKGWTLADDFHIELEVNAPASGWFRRLRGRATTILLHGDGRAHAGTLLREKEQQSMRVTLGRDFPSRLQVSVGDADIVARAAGFKSKDQRAAEELLSAFLMRR